MALTEQHLGATVDIKFVTNISLYFTIVSLKG